LKELQADNFTALAEEDPRYLEWAQKALVELIQNLIKQFGNNGPSMIEIFIRPYLLLTHVAISSREIQLGVQTYTAVAKIVHELYGEESELELQLQQASLSISMLRASDLTQAIH